MPKRPILTVLAAGLLAVGVAAVPAAADEAPQRSDAQAEANPFTNTGELARQPGHYPRPRLRPEWRHLEVTRRDCRRLAVRRLPSDDAIYKPGVDVRGKPVVPAEADDSFSYTLPDVIVFELKIDPLAGTGLDRELFGPTTLSLGQIRFGRATGLLTLDGQPLTDPLKAEIEKRCRAAGFLE